MLAQFWAISTVEDGIKLRYLLLSCDYHSISRRYIVAWILFHAMHSIAWTTLKSIRGAPMSPKVSTGYTVYQLVVLICKGICILCHTGDNIHPVIFIHSFIHCFANNNCWVMWKFPRYRKDDIDTLHWMTWEPNAIHRLGHDVIYHITLSLKRKSKWQLSVQPVIPSKWHRYPSRRMWTDHLLPFPFSSRTWNCVVI